MEDSREWDAEPCPLKAIHFAHLEGRKESDCKPISYEWNRMESNGIEIKINRLPFRHVLLLCRASEASGPQYTECTKRIQAVNTAVAFATSMTPPRILPSGGRNKEAVEFDHEEIGRTPCQLRRL